MLNEELLDKIFYEMQEKIENKISKEYHKKIKEIKYDNEEEKDNIKLGIISELYYKQGFKDGINFIINNMKNKQKKFKKMPKILAK